MPTSCLVAILENSVTKVGCLYQIPSFRNSREKISSVKLTTWLLLLIRLKDNPSFVIVFSKTLNSISESSISRFDFSNLLLL